MTTIAIDIGYGDVKVKTEDKEFKFPTSVAFKKINNSNFEKLEGVNKKGVYVYNNKEYIVGASGIDNAFNTRNPNFLLNYSPLLIFHALKESGIEISSKDKENEDIILATGLSVFNWNVVKQFQETIKDFEISDGFKFIDGEKITNKRRVKFKKVVIRPQGRGAFDSYKKGDKSGLVYVVDIGYNTLDILAYQDSEAQIDLSLANENGANKIITDMQTILDNYFPKVGFTEQNAKQVFIDGKIKIAGKEQDLSAEIQELKLNYTEFLANELSSNAKMLYKADKVIFCGGGANIIDKEEIIRLIPTADFVDIPFDFANVRGYYEIATRNR